MRLGIGQFIIILFLVFLLFGNFAKIKFFLGDWGERVQKIAKNLSDKFGK